MVDDLCQMLNLSTERISIWFQNRRARFKKARKLQAQETGFSTTTTTNLNRLPANKLAENNFQSGKYAFENSVQPASVSHQGFPNLYSNVGQQYSDMGNKLENYPIINMNASSNNGFATHLLGNAQFSTENYRNLFYTQPIESK